MQRRWRITSSLDLNIDSDRAYLSYSEMLEAERRRPDRIDVVSIVTPNHLHFEISNAFLEAGIHVICDRPMTVSLDEAIELVRIVRHSGLVFVLTQNNTGYPMVRQARAMVREGLLGNIRVVRVSYNMCRIGLRLGSKRAVKSRLPGG